MVAMGVLMDRLIGDSQRGKADARASGLASAAASLYQSEASLARGDAETLARAVGPLSGHALMARFTSLATRAGLARARLSAGSKTLADVGARSANAPGAAVLAQGRATRVMTMTVSEVTAAQYARELAAPGVAIVVGEELRVLSSTVPVRHRFSQSTADDTPFGHTRYRAVRQVFGAFDRAPVTVTVFVRSVGDQRDGGGQSRRRRGAYSRVPGTRVRLLGARLARTARTFARLSPGGPASGQRRLVVADQGRGP